MRRRRVNIWVLDDGRPGTVAQSVGIARALNVPFARKSIVYNIFANFPNVLRKGPLLGVDEVRSDILADPWPQVIISAGRRAAPIALRCRDHAGPGLRLVQIMDPGCDPELFDVLVLPKHDLDLSEAPTNAIATLGAPVALTPQRLAEIHALPASGIDDLPGPRIAVLLGGAGKGKALGPANAANLGKQISQLAESCDGSVMATSSRRTGRDGFNAFSEQIEGPAFVHEFGGDGPNPYEQILAHADAIVVSSDSISMMCEAVASAVPVYLFDPVEDMKPKYRHLADELISAGLARRLDSQVQSLDLGWQRAPVNESARVANLLKAKWPDVFAPTD